MFLPTKMLSFRVISITLTQFPNLLLPKPSQLSGFQLFVICHVNFKWQKWICTTWPSFLFSWRLLFITSKKKLNKLFHASFIHKNCFELFLPAIFYLRYSQLESHVCRLQLTWLQISLLSKKLLTRIEDVIPVQKLKNWSSVSFLMEWKRCTHSACYLGIFLEIQDLSSCCLPQNHILQNQIVYSTRQLVFS